MTQPLFYWHIHHNKLCELLIEPLKERIAFIKKDKPKEEVSLRLKLLKPVKGKLPKGLVGAGKAYHKAWDAYVKAGEIYNKTLKSLSIKRSFEKLHKIEHPNCPWDSDQSTIFPKK